MCVNWNSKWLNFQCMEYFISHVYEAATNSTHNSPREERARIEKAKSKKAKEVTSTEKQKKNTKIAWDRTVFILLVPDCSAFLLFIRLHKFSVVWLRQIEKILNKKTRTRRKKHSIKALLMARINETPCTMYVYLNDTYKKRINLKSSWRV